MSSIFEEASCGYRTEAADSSGDWTCVPLETTTRSVLHLCHLPTDECAKWVDSTRNAASCCWTNRDFCLARCQSVTRLLRADIRDGIPMQCAAAVMSRLYCSALSRSCNPTRFLPGSALPGGSRLLTLEEDPLQTGMSRGTRYAPGATPRLQVFRYK
ncbi:uncharacterized protein PITG_05743 [Phytophthora infestans T30-4]|uniref:Uncharacterized protein n=1 Tax=Phytophthora infestans (strain T30-4) TaxID=403677 RepID=D0N5K7_PHYIT|nr:uncharacterized protein PITG_05743 [Phytophthora infestans T30-4]EEY70348.1 hypothetical protein PITG_05743 [Phytophthora infestans T30-4]|eukprot:XP_002998002.1 hypothetical protein PITG_05743 [Phytophthora infestans T30-4]